MYYLLKITVYIHGLVNSILLLILASFLAKSKRLQPVNNYLLILSKYSLRHTSVMSEGCTFTSSCLMLQKQEIGSCSMGLIAQQGLLIK